MTEVPPAEKAGFRTVKATVLSGIESGRWGPGAQLPGEVDLAESLGVARATVNRAMRELAEEGLIERRKRAGSRVVAAPRREARFRIPVVREEIEATGAPYRYTLVSDAVIAAPGAVRARMGLVEGARVRHVLCLHAAGARSFQLEERWISLEALPEAAHADFRTRGPTEWLIAAVPFSEVEVSFLAEAAAPQWAALLGMEPGDPVFIAERTTWWQGRSVTHVRLRFHAGYRMTTRY
jgi:GntR family histidine utilization transcriptional repressor